MGAPSLEDLEYEYDLLCRLLEEGRSWSPPPAATAAAPSQSQFSSPSQSQSQFSSPSQSQFSSPPPLLQGGAPCTTSEPPRRRTPPWASAIRGFSNTLWLVILVLLVVPMAMQSTDKEDVFRCVGIFLMSFAFPVMGYVVTWDQP